MRNLCLPIGSFYTDTVDHLVALEKKRTVKRETALSEISPYNKTIANCQVLA